MQKCAFSFWGEGTQEEWSISSVRAWNFAKKMAEGGDLRRFPGLGLQKLESRTCQCWGSDETYWLWTLKGYIVLIRVKHK